MMAEFDFSGITQAESTGGVHGIRIDPAIKRLGKVAENFVRDVAVTMLRGMSKAMPVGVTGHGRTRIRMQRDDPLAYRVGILEPATGEDAGFDYAVAMNYGIKGHYVYFTDYRTGAVRDLLVAWFERKAGRTVPRTATGRVHGRAWVWGYSVPWCEKGAQEGAAYARSAMTKLQGRL